MIAMMLPMSFFAQRFNVIGKLYAANVIGYGIVMFGMSGVKDYRGLWACRFFLGTLEGGNPSLGGLLVSCLPAALIRSRCGGGAGSRTCARRSCTRPSRAW
jgi:hypothetical protein